MPNQPTSIKKSNRAGDAGGLLIRKDLDYVLSGPAVWLYLQTPENTNRLSRGKCKKGIKESWVEVVGQQVLFHVKSKNRLLSQSKF